MITVAVPIGPFKGCTLYLEECLDSIRTQTQKASELLIIDDMANPIAWRNILTRVVAKGGLEDTRITVIDNPWLMGVAASFNIGVATAVNDLVIMLGSDDKLLPNCIEQCTKAWLARKEPLGYYHMDVQYDNGEIQDLPCNAAMVHKRLWQHTGGFPPETSIGAPDAAFISILLTHASAGKLIRIGGGPLYWVRRHVDQDTAKRGPYQNAILQVRNLVALGWKQPQWGRGII
jgi:glycosyltransferase involved in cell wall biosynthesis